MENVSNQCTACKKIADEVVCISCLEKASVIEVYAKIESLLEHIHNLRKASAMQEELSENAIEELVETIERERYLHIQSTMRFEAQIEMIENEKNEQLAELRSLLHE